MGNVIPKFLRRSNTDDDKLLKTEQIKKISKNIITLNEEEIELLSSSIESLNTRLSRSLRNSVKKDLFELKLLSMSNKITEFKDNIAEYKQLLSSNDKYSEFSEPVNKLENKLNIIISKLEEVKKENNISEIKDHKQIKHKKITKKLKFD